MRSSIYLNQLSPEHLTWDASRSPQQLADVDSAIGFTFLKTLEHLGLRHEVEITSQEVEEEGLPIYYDPTPPLYHLHGSVEQMKSEVMSLQRHIGLIARYGAELSDYSRDFHKGMFGRMLGKIVQETVPNFKEDEQLYSAFAKIIYPFASYTNDDGVLIFHGEIPEWRS